MAEPIRASRRGRVLVLRLDRPGRHNAIDGSMLTALDAALEGAAGDPGIRFVLLEGSEEVFCSGLDLEEALPRDGGGLSRDAAEAGARRYFATLRRLALSSKVIACRVAGRCEAGGVGLVAAADFAVAEPSARFRLSETLIGLLPATLMPFLIRRVGYRAAFRLTLAAPMLDAEEALRIGLVDAAGHDAEEALRRVFLACERVPERTVAAAKAYFDGLSPMGAAVEDYAVGHIADLLADPANGARIRRLMAEGVWQGGWPAAAGAATASARGAETR